MDQLCILGCNAKPSEPSRNYPIKIVLRGVYDGITLGGINYRNG